MSNFYTEVICRDPRFRSSEPVDDVALLEPVTRAAVQSMISAARVLGRTITVAETYRSRERQERLFQEHLTELRDVGVHAYGLACDFRLSSAGRYDPRGEDYLFLRGLAEEHGLISGVDWGEPTVTHSFRDWDHVQRVSLIREKSLFACRWYPDDSYRPLPDYRRNKPTPINAPLVTKD